MGSKGESRRIIDIEITDVQKRRTPSKHYVYIINVSWSDGVANVIYRRYSRFFDFQHILLGKFPLESGQLDPNKRVIPFLPGKIYFGRSHVRDVALKRLQPIEEYCKSLINLPDHISQCEDVQDFFDVEPDDLNPEDDYQKKKKSANFEVSKISGPKLAEQYRVIADYQKEDKWDLNLKAGTEVEVVEKSESGWWFVSVEDQQGWVPSTYLKRKDGSSEIFSQRAKPGEEESYISTESYEPASNDEIRLDKGAVVDVIEKKLDGWWFVRYKGLEGWAPATYLMKAEKAHMQRVARASGVEIVGGLSDISTLLKGEGSQAESTAAPPRPHIPKLYKKSASMERGGSIRPPPRQNSIKNINVDALKPSLSREDKRYITLAEFKDTVGDGISFEKGEIVHVKEKNDGGWWFVKIGQKEGWAPSSFLTKADLDLDDVSEDGQDPVEDPDYFSVPVESDDDDDDDDTDYNTVNDSNEWEDENVYEEVEYEVPQTSYQEESKAKPIANKSQVFMPNIGIKIASKFKKDSEILPTVQQKSREKSPRRALGHSGLQRPTSRPPPPPLTSNTENVEMKGNTEKMKSIGVNRDSLAAALNNQLHAKLSSDSSKSSSDGERSETGKSRPLLPAKPSLSEGLNRSPLETDRKSRFEFGNKSPKHSRGSSPRGSEQQDPLGGSLANILKSKFEKRQVPNIEAIDSSKAEGQFHTYPKKPLIPPSKMKSESKEVDKDTSTNSYKSLPLPKSSDRPLTPPKTVKSSTNLQVGNKEMSPKRHSMQEEGSDLASLLKAKFESRRQSADVSSINYSYVDKQKKKIPQKPLLPPKFDKNKSKNSEVSVGKPPCLPKPDIGSDTNAGKPSVAAALKSKFEGIKQSGKPKLPGAKPAKPSSVSNMSNASSVENKSADLDKNIKTVGNEIPVKSGFAKSLAAKLAGNVPGADKPVLAPKGDNSSNLSSSVSEESQNYPATASTKHYKTLAGYCAESEGEISFNEGVMVVVLDKSDGWWLVKINQEEGWAPATYIGEVEMDQNVSTTERSASPVIDSGFTSPEEGSNSVSSQKYRTTAEFVGESDNELGFKEGVYAKVLDCSDDDWWYVRIDGNEGWVPADFLEEV